MPFSGNVAGIHDAVWRTEFGGNLYQLEGSHGCVNLPYDQAAATSQQCGDRHAGSGISIEENEYKKLDMRN